MNVPFVLRRAAGNRTSMIRRTRENVVKYRFTSGSEKMIRYKRSITLEEGEAKENWRETVQTLKGHIYRNY